MYELLISQLSKHISLDPTETDRLKDYFRVKQLKKKQFLQHQGDVTYYETFVTKGCLRTYYLDQQGQEHIVQFALESWWIGDLYSFLTQHPSRYTIQALEDCELLQIDKNSLEELYQEVPKLERFFRIIIQNAFIASTNRVLSSMSQPAEERYLEFIGKYPDIEQRVPQYHVAAYLGVTAEFLSRIRKKFSRK
jgi:CRP-like cAMP-binding protein